MRDLERILKNIKTFYYDESFLYEAIERAIKAEAEVKRLKKVYAITNKSWEKQVEELAQLRNVAEAARGVFLGEGEHLCSEFEDAMDRLRQALAELDEEGE